MNPHFNGDRIWCLREPLPVHETLVEISWFNALVVASTAAASTPRYLFELNDVFPQSLFRRGILVSSFFFIVLLLFVSCFFGSLHRFFYFFFLSPHFSLSLASTHVMFALGTCILRLMTTPGWEGPLGDQSIRDNPPTNQPINQAYGNLRLTSSKSNMCLRLHPPGSIPCPLLIKQIERV